MRQIECFANYVNAGNARMDAGHAGNACVDADTQRQESLRRLRDLVDARERAMADSVCNNDIIISLFFFFFYCQKYGFNKVCNNCDR